MIVYHGTTKVIEKPDVLHSKKYLDFGQGFYCGESYEQSALYVENFEDSKIYFLAFEKNDLKYIKYNVDQDWMLTIAYYRGKLEKYAQHKKIQNLISKLVEIDYIIAPIADNKMFRIIDAFIEGEITDEQCKHCLSASNLGYQYVILSEKAISKLRKLECCYYSIEERISYRNTKKEENKTNEDKVKLARIKYRGKGQYIDEILK